MTDRVATSAEVASVLGLSASTVQLYARQGRIPFASTPGGHRRYNVSEVQLALDAGPDGEDAVTLLLTPLAGGIGIGRQAPTSANAQQLRAVRVAGLENGIDGDVEQSASMRSSAGTVSGERTSALALMVTHSRSLSLICVKA